jgi:hypothetical protein
MFNPLFGFWIWAIGESEAALPKPESPCGLGEHRIHHTHTSLPADATHRGVSFGSEADLEGASGLTAWPMAVTGQERTHIEIKAQTMEREKSARPLALVPYES